MLITLVIAVHFAHLPLAVDYAQSRIADLVPYVPTLIAVWIQLRFGLRTLQATLTHYGVCISWAFLYGYGYCITLNARNASTRAQGRMLDPISWAYDDMQEMAVIALITSAIYAAVSLWATRKTNSTFELTPEDAASANHPMQRSTRSSELVIDNQPRVPADASRSAIEN